MSEKKSNPQPRPVSGCECQSKSGANNQCCGGSHENGKCGCKTKK